MDETKVKTTKKGNSEISRRNFLKISKDVMVGIGAGGVLTNIFWVNKVTCPPSKCHPLSSIFNLIGLNEAINVMEKHTIHKCPLRMMLTISLLMAEIVIQETRKKD